MKECDNHPQHAGLNLKPCKISDHMLRYMGFKFIDLVLVQSGDNAIKSTAAMGMISLSLINLIKALSARIICH